MPYPKHRHAIAALVRRASPTCGPNAFSAERATAVAQSELVTIYPRRGAVPADLWRRLLDQATEQIGILAYGGLFLHELNPRLHQDADREGRGRREGRGAARRPGQRPRWPSAARDEGIGDSMAGKIRNVLAFYEPTARPRRDAVLYHDTMLYNSIYRFDDEMLVNTHLFGHPAAHAPVMHLRRLAGGDLFDTYAGKLRPRPGTVARASGPTT